MTQKTNGETIAANLSKEVEDTLRSYAERTGTQFEALIQSVIVRQIESINEGSEVFDAILALQGLPISKRKARFEIHPLVAEFLRRASGIIGIGSERMAGICLESEAQTLAEDLEELDRECGRRKPRPRIHDALYSAKVASELSMLLSIPLPVLARLEQDTGVLIPFARVLQSPWLENWKAAK